MRVQELIGLSALERKNKIIENIPNFYNFEDEIDQAQAIADVINTFIEDYIDKKILDDMSQNEGGILSNSAKLDSEIEEEYRKFLPIAIKNLKDGYEAIRTTQPKNVYELSGAYKLAFASNATRTLSTTMGLFLESMASISPYVVNPEKEFGIKIKGVDLILKNMHTDKIEYLQLKTQRNTLTGSQKERVVKELSIYENPVVAACFSLANWTFNDSSIERVAGADFWDKIGIPYNVVKQKTGEFIKKMEDAYVDLL